MTVTIHTDVYQGTPEWYALRCGILTASEIDEIVTPANLKPANNDKARKHLYNLAAQRITGHVPESFQSYDMMRGSADEIEARSIYERTYAPVDQVGFITNDKWGFKLGYSPDGLVGEDGLIECKSRAPKFQIETILNAQVPSEFMIQLQVGMLVSERPWIDFISYCGGLPMMTKRVQADTVFQDALINAAAAFYERMDEVIIQFAEKIHDTSIKLVPTERKDYDFNDGSIV